MAKILDIITHPHDKILRRRSVEVGPDEIKTADFKDLCADMALTMEKKDGVGLAAPQIGRNIRLIVVAFREGPVCLINPVFKKRSFWQEWGREGCLSVPEKTGEVRRHRRLVCEYSDSEGRKRTIEANGLMARILQHEVDHLDGVLFIDKARDIKAAV